MSIVTLMQIAIQDSIARGRLTGLSDPIVRNKIPTMNNAQRTKNADLQPIAGMYHKQIEYR